MSATAITDPHVVLGVNTETYKIVNHPLSAKEVRVTVSVACLAGSFSIGEEKSIATEHGASSVFCKEIRPMEEWEREPFIPCDHIATFVSA